MGLRLPNNARIAIIGGGPAGTFFAHFMLKMGERTGVEPDITIYDRKSFLDYGPKGCNMCAGAIGHHLVDHLRRENIPLPADVVRQEVDGYVLHAGGGRVFLRQDDRPIYTVFRGNSPDSFSEGITGFDQFLLDHAISMGAQFKREKIIRVIWPENSFQKVRLLGKSSGETEADLVVGAFGVNTNLRHKFLASYRPPNTWIACQAEMPVDPEFSHRVLGNNIHVFALGERNVRFLALTPKATFITVSAIGPAVMMADLEKVLERPEVRPYVPKDWAISCHCHPRFPVTAAEKPYRDRGVLVGDACQARYLKNGIESAYFTAMFAAKTCLQRGIAASDLAHYHQLCRRKFSFDNSCGKILFAIHNAVASHPRFARAHLLLSEAEQMEKGRKQQVLSNSLWSMFTGDTPYRRILRRLLNPAIQLKLMREACRSLIYSGPAWDRYAEKKRARLRTGGSRGELRLQSGMTVAIIGGGPGGASCAIRLLNRAHAAGIRPRVVVFEGKDFDRHYNQCVGALSPPLERILREELDTSLPPELIKRRIESYRLHSDNADVLLNGHVRSEPTYTVRRVMFDRFLLKQAEVAGADVIRSRVTGVEFVNVGGLDEVRIYSESQYLKADVVVGAFGLDEAMLNCWERATDRNHAYQRPQKMLKTFITKIHTDPAFIESTFGNTIHAFLLSGPRVEFGAVTPKGDHIIINVAGKNVCSLDLDEFLDRPQVRALLPEIDHKMIDYYAGNFPTSRARNAYGHRYVLVGDTTGWMRPFKGKGINTAVITGIRAADVIMDHGFSRKALRAYARNSADLRNGYYYGIAIRSLCRFGRSCGLFDSVLHVANADERLQEIFYMAVSGEDSYGNILRRLLSPSTFRKLAMSSGKDILKRFRRARATA